MANIKMSEHICPAILIGNLTPDSWAGKGLFFFWAIVSKRRSNTCMNPANELVIVPVCVDERDITVQRGEEEEEVVARGGGLLLFNNQWVQSLICKWEAVSLVNTQASSHSWSVRTSTRQGENHTLQMTSIFTNTKNLFNNRNLEIFFSLSFFPWNMKRKMKPSVFQ